MPSTYLFTLGSAQVKTAHFEMVIFIINHINKKNDISTTFLQQILSDKLY